MKNIESHCDIKPKAQGVCSSVLILIRSMVRNYRHHHVAVAERVACIKRAFATCAGTTAKTSSAFILTSLLLYSTSPKSLLPLFCQESPLPKTPPLYSWVFSLAAPIVCVLFDRLSLDVIVQTANVTSALIVDAYIRRPENRSIQSTLKRKRLNCSSMWE